MSAQVELSVLVAGVCHHPEKVARRGGSLAPVPFPALVGVIRHPDHGVVLYDTGYAPRFRQATNTVPEALYRWVIPVQCNDRDTAAAQLRDQGIHPDEVRHVVLSHFHADHVAGLRDFPRATITYRREALTWRRPAGSALLTRRWRTRFTDTAHGFVPRLLPDDLQARSRFVEDLPPTPQPDLAAAGLGPVHDLFGDGSLLGVGLPGHVPGQLGLFVPRPARGPAALFAADACWDSRSFTHGDLPHPIARAAVHDWAAYRRTVSALGELSRRHGPGRGHEILVLPSHCATSIARAREVWGTP